MNEIQRSFLTSGTHPSNRKTPAGSQSDARPASVWGAHTQCAGPGGGQRQPLRPPAERARCVCAHTHHRLSAHVRACPARGSPLLPVVLCPCAPTAGPITPAPAAAPAAAQHLREVVHDGGLFGVEQVELPGEEDEVDIERVQVSM